MYSFLHHRLFIVFCSFLIGMGTLTSCSQPKKQATETVKEIIYVGTFDGNGSKGLYVFEFNPKTQQMNQIQVVSNRKGPSFQAIDPTGHYLYSVSGEAFTDSTKEGTISAYKIDQQTGKLTLINEQSVQGQGPAHVSVGPKGKLVYVSNYGSGDLSVFKINDDGSLTRAVTMIQHHGSSVNKKRQLSAHVHSIIPAADGKQIYVSDLGMDKIMIYNVERQTGALTPAETPYFKSTPGAGPRHFAIHPSGKFAYSAEEMGSTVAVLKIDQATGALSQIQRLSTLPKDYTKNNTVADIQVSPDGKFLYVSNRGHNSLVIYKIDEATGKLSRVGWQPVKGERPRNFLIGKKGNYVWVANMNSNNVTLFKRDKTSGKLTYTGTEVNIPIPVCVNQLILD